ncbi:Hypothetical Protein [Fusobacterium vincentii ATCC 49256]|uniref:Uncharacterized protein n=1 Tax=Fusobacterium vincentii ATCC 49256 TaxID=209882 RepID=Q7P2C9_FUSVC|nr:Hypothetical Protein [Fusobacterium vincentii ATCC 49256]
MANACKAYQEVTKKLGEWIGKSNYNLVYGGRQTSGLMGLIADSVLENGRTGSREL